MWGKLVISESTVQRWFQKFRRGEFDLEDKECHERPSSVDDHNTEVMKSGSVEENTINTVRKLWIRKRHVDSLWSVAKIIHHSFLNPGESITTAK